MLFVTNLSLWLLPPPTPRMPPTIYDDVSYLLPLDLWTSIQRPTKDGVGKNLDLSFNIHNTINTSRALSVLWGGGIFPLTWLLSSYLSLKALLVHYLISSFSVQSQNLWMARPPPLTHDVRIGFSMCLCATPMHHHPPALYFVTPFLPFSRTHNLVTVYWNH